MVEVGRPGEAEGTAVFDAGVAAAGAVPGVVREVGVDWVVRGFIPARFEAFGLVKTGIVCFKASSIASACN